MYDIYIFFVKNNKIRLSNCVIVFLLHFNIIKRNGTFSSNNIQNKQFLILNQLIHYFLTTDFSQIRLIDSPCSTAIDNIMRFSTNISSLLTCVTIVSFSFILNTLQILPNLYNFVSP